MIGNDSWTFFSNFSISVWFSENLNDNHDMSYPPVTVTDRWETVRVFHISVHFPHILFEGFHDMYSMVPDIFLCECDLSQKVCPDLVQPLKQYICCSGGRLPSPENSQLQTLGDFKK